jgi:hypothetical protein
MNSLPTELNLKVLHLVRDSIPNEAFTSNADASMTHAAEYNALLLRMARYHRHWTALAQSELFHHIILADENKPRLLLKLLRKRRNGVFRSYADKASSMRLGNEITGYAQDYDDLKDHLDELAGYCPNIVEISCACVNTLFSDFRELSPVQAQAKLMKVSLAQKISRLDRLNVYGGRHDGSGSFSLSITQLSVKYCALPTALDPASFPFLSHLFYECWAHHSPRSILPLLPQIQSLRIGNSCSSQGTNQLISASTSLTTISISDSQFRRFTDESHNIIKARLEMIRVIISRYGGDFSKLADCVTSSMVSKKVILDGLMPVFQARERIGSRS